jgi:hypothetical protein
LDLRSARDQLFAAPLERFVETRAELAAELAQNGQKDDSKTLKGIRRPSLSAWATNQVVRNALAEVTAFFEANDHLRQVQHAMMSGQSERTAYQAAAETFRDATTVLGTAIRETLEGLGRNVEAPLVERVLSNVRLAAVSDQRRDEVLSGQLENDVASGEDDLASVFGAALSGAPGAPPAAPAKVGPVTVNKEATRIERLEQARRDREQQARAQEEEARQRLQAARDDEAAAVKQATEAEARATQARAACDQARERLDEADRAATQARQTWRDAQLVAQRADREAAETKAKKESAVQRREGIERKSR